MKNGPLKYILVVLCVMVFGIGFSQNPQPDVITTKKGEHINCTVIRSDTAKLYFKVSGNISGIEVSKPLSEIQEIQYAKREPPAIGQPSTEVQKDDYVPVNTPTVDTQNKKLVHPKRTNCLSFFAGLAYPVGPFNDAHLDTNQIGPGIL